MQRAALFISGYNVCPEEFYQERKCALSSE